MRLDAFQSKRHLRGRVKSSCNIQRMAAELRSSSLWTWTRCRRALLGRATAAIATASEEPDRQPRYGGDDDEGDHQGAEIGPHSPHRDIGVDPADRAGGIEADAEG